jgi:DNA alkylation damage repair protein AlkB
VMMNSEESSSRDDSDESVCSRIALAVERARAAAAERTAASAIELRAFLRRRHPLSFSRSAPREAVRNSAGDRVGLRRATHEELLTAVQAEASAELLRATREETPFRAAERLFRVGGCVAQLSDAIERGALDFSLASASEAAVLLPPVSAPLGLEWACDALNSRIYALPSHLGAYVVRDALNISTQEALVRASLREWAEPPQRRNTDDAHGRGGPTDLWHNWRRNNATSPLNALAWATLGYTYDWTNRRYWLAGDDAPQDVNPTEWTSGGFPPSLARLCEGLVDLTRAHVAAAHASGDTRFPVPERIRCEAGIVNFYRGAAKLRQPMGGHRDDGERWLYAPVVSISLGAPAVFLLGGTSAHTTPLPIILRSGDALILSCHSRTAFHGVARVFDDATGDDAAPLFWQREGAPSSDDGEEEVDFHRWIRNGRININVRQVVE